MTCDREQAGKLSERFYWMYRPGMVDTLNFLLTYVSRKEKCSKMNNKGLRESGGLDSYTEEGRNKVGSC